MYIVFQLHNVVNETKEGYDVYNFSLTSTQGIFRCVASNSFGNGDDSLKLYISGE
jgi:hypothetical protein